MSASTLKWKKHFSKSQNLHYWHNSETDEKFWDIEDKNDPRFWVQLKSKSKDPKNLTGIILLHINHNGKTQEKRKKFLM